MAMTKWVDITESEKPRCGPQVGLAMVTLVMELRKVESVALHSCVTQELSFG